MLRYTVDLLFSPEAENRLAKYNLYVKCSGKIDRESPKYATYKVLDNYCRYENTDTLNKITYNMYHSRLYIDIFR